MSEEFLLYLLRGTITVLVLVVGWNVRNLFGRIKEHEKATQDRFEKNRERHDADVSAVYKHQTKKAEMLSDKLDAKTESLRTDINSLSEALRKEIKQQGDRTNTIILQLATKGAID